jgi:transcriptional regulator with XRE-family HTH domain
LIEQVKGKPMNALRKARIEKGWTIEELAGKSGTSPATISHLENGTRKARWLTLKKLADVLGVEVESLIDKPAIPNEKAA